MPINLHILCIVHLLFTLYTTHIVLREHFAPLEESVEEIHVENMVHFRLQIRL